MNTDTFFMFTEIINNGSITQTAERLHISQSALSQQMKTMEEALGCKLLERSNRGVRTTAAGDIVYRCAQDILASYQEMQNKLDALRHGDKVFRIASMPAIYTYALPCALFQIQKKVPGVRIETSVLPSIQVEQRISAAQSDIGFVVGKPASGELYSKHIFSDRVYLVAGQGVDTAGPLTPETLCKQPLVMMSKPHKLRLLLDSYLQQSLHVPMDKLNTICDFESLESLKSSAINGLGLAFLPYSAIKKELYNKQLRTVEIVGFDFEYEYYLIKNKKVKLNDTQLQKLSGYLEKALESMLC